MGLKKYEIITVGSDKRVRALRSWQVGDRYVNIGDVGGIVYDEKTLSQDGACWLFRGNFGFPGARIGGDSIVDVAEAALSTTGAPNVDILGSSVVVGSKLQFEAGQTAADAVVLTADDFEQGDCTFVVGSALNDQKISSTNVIRLKDPIFMGGVAKTVKLSVPGFSVIVFGLDRDLRMVSSTPVTETGEGVTLTIPASQYCYIRLRKNPLAPTVPADATTAAITFTGTYETKLSVIDSRVEINPATSMAISVITPGGIHAISPGVKYPDSVIRNSKVVINGNTTYNRIIRLISEFTGCNVTIDATLGNSRSVGIYSNVNNLTFTGELANTAVAAYDIIRATDCNDFAVSPAIFPGLAAALSANKPFIFQGCNVPGGRFPHDPRINNTYINIDFAKAQTDLNKVASGFYMCSSNVEGMYRLGTSNNILGCLVESYESIKSFSMPASDSGYNTTIYKDAYFSGKFDFAGTNVFGNTRKHDTQDVSGCKIKNTGETAVNMKGNIRVEGNATLTNCSIIGSGYFGGNAVASGLRIGGAAFMSDNASFVKTGGTANIRNLKMTDNAKAVIGDVVITGSVHIKDNAVFTPTNLYVAEADFYLQDNAKVTAGVSVNGSLLLKDNATVNRTLTVVGCITLCGSYNQTADKTWTGKRVIDNENAPEYDNNVKTKYDF